MKKKRRTFKPPMGFFSWIDTLPRSEAQRQLEFFKLYGRVLDSFGFNDFMATLA